MKIIKKFCILLSLIMLFFVIAPAVNADVVQNLDASVQYGCNTADGLLPLLGGSYQMDTAASAILYEANTQTLMYAWNPDVRMYPASLVKIMTAMIALEEGTLTDIVTVTDKVLETVPENAVSAELVADEVISLQDLLYCMMVGSANDAAAVLADYVAGSQKLFVEKMNLRAQELGCKDTLFTDVHGLDGDQYTTVRDMARILGEALKNTQFLKVFGAVYYKTEATNKSEVRSLSTGNYLLNDDEISIYYDKRVTGSRTGIADNGDRCIASTAAADGMQMVTVVMGAKSEYTDDGYRIKIYGGYKETSALLDLGFDGYVAAQLLYKDQALLQKEVENGDCQVVLGPQENAAAVLPAGVTTNELTYKFDDLPESASLPVKRGDKLSEVEIWYGNICLAQADLYALNQVNTITNMLDRGKENSVFSFTTVLIVLALAAAACVVILFGIRLVYQIRYNAAQNRSRKRRRNRRRSR